MKDFLQISGPPGLLSAADHGLWWSNSFNFTKDQYLHRLISNFTKHELPFTHLVMDFGWHQQQHGSAWASYTWSKEFGETPADVQDFVQSLHSTDTASPMQRPLALSLNLHAVGVEPEELRYREFMQQVHFANLLLYLLPFALSVLVWRRTLWHGECRYAQSPLPCRFPS